MGLIVKTRIGTPRRLRAAFMFILSTKADLERLARLDSFFSQDNRSGSFRERFHALRIRRLWQPSNTPAQTARRTRKPGCNQPSAPFGGPKLAKVLFPPLSLRPPIEVDWQIQSSAVAYGLGKSDWRRRGSSGHGNHSFATHRPDERGGNSLGRYRAVKPAV